MDTLGDHHTKLSRTEKNKYHMVSLYIESKKKERYKWTYLQNGNRLRDLENKLMVTKGEMLWGVEGIYSEFGINIYTLPYIKYIINKDLL